MWEVRLVHSAQAKCRVHRASKETEPTLTCSKRFSHWIFYQESLVTGFVGDRYPMCNVACRVAQLYSEMKRGCSPCALNLTRVTRGLRCTKKKISCKQPCVPSVSFDVFSEKLRSKHCHVPKNPKASRRKDLLLKLDWLLDITYLLFASFINTEHLKTISFKYNIKHI